MYDSDTCEQTVQYKVAQHSTGNMWTECYTLGETFFQNQASSKLGMPLRVSQTVYNRISRVGHIMIQTYVPGYRLIHFGHVRAGGWFTVLG
jgi:hypothetical protein